MNMVVRFTSFRLPSALVAWEGLAPVFTHHIDMVAALKSLTHAAVLAPMRCPRTFTAYRLLSRYRFHLSAGCISQS